MQRPRRMLAVSTAALAALPLGAAPALAGVATGGRLMVVRRDGA